ncbi:histidine-containing phosphotransfer protein 1-like [Capsicum annuum]|uniref:histidine-containing phosphotransfer protein 1-like n=1 Tax=Capsicum annuum TaxID=4072 RepID=UPI001FB0F809|nr:histidine-containing phosphotransfer protein 1-like [Capsicum annuum]
MRNMTYVLESSVVDFDILNVQCHKLKGSAACIGACKLKKACDPFIAGVDKKSKIECLWALKDIKQECRVFRSKTKTFMKLEKEIVEAEKSKS